MPTRRDFELIIIVTILLHPALSLVRVWAQKHMATSNSPGGGVSASVAAELF